MFGVLLKKQMTEIFRAYFYNAKKNTKRSLLSTILFMILYGILMVGVMGGMFSYLALQLCRPFTQVHMEWFYFLLMSLIAIALGTFGSVFNTYSGLYLSKDNDLLLSMPIPARSILLARLASVYLMGFMYSAVVSLPTIIVYWVQVQANIWTVTGGIVLVLVLSFLVLFLSCVLGWCVAKISQKLKNKSLITVVVSLVFLGAYYFVFYKAQTVIMALLNHAVLYGDKVKEKAYLAYLFGRIGQGDGLAMLLYLLITLFLCGVTFLVMSKSFIHMVTMQESSAKKKYVEKRAKQRKPSMALLLKELGKFLSSPTYILNCGLGTVFSIILGVFVLVKKEDILSVVEWIWSDGKGNEAITIIAISTIIFTAAMNIMVVPSVSLEGKSIWIAQSLPVAPWEWLKAKMKLQIMTTLIPVLVCSICVVAAVSQSVEQTIAIIGIPALFVLFMTVFGMFLGISMPNLTWTNETAPIKQSISVIIALIGGWALGIGNAVLYFLWCHKIGVNAYVLLEGILLLVVTAAFSVWLKKRGAKLFAML